MKKWKLIPVLAMIGLLTGCDGIIDLTGIMDPTPEVTKQIEEPSPEITQPTNAPTPTPEIFTSELEKEAAEIIDGSIEIAKTAVLKNRRESNPDIMKSSYYEPFQDDMHWVEKLNERQTELFWKLLEVGRNREDLVIKGSEYGWELIVDYLTIAKALERYDPFLDCCLYVDILTDDLIVRYYDPHKDGNFCVTRGSEEWEQMEHDMDLLAAVISRVIRKMPEDLSTYEKYYYLAAVVSARVEYSLETRNDANPFGALVDGKALCEGYSEAFFLLCKEANLACYLQSGMTGQEGHAWNLIALEGGTYNVDVTWCDGYEPGEWNWDRYFATTEDESIASGHELREGSPATGPAYY